MKQILSTLALMVLVFAAIAQAPAGVSYQAVARNSSGAILASQPIGLRFSIHDATPTGAVVYQETFSVTTTPLGLFNINLGTGAAVSGTFSGINWSTNSKYLQVEMDPAGGSSYVSMGTALQMMSVPYALYSSNGMPAGSASGDLLYWNGSSWVRLAAGNPGQIMMINSSGLPAWSNILLPTVTTGAFGGGGGVATGAGTVTGAGITPVTAYGVCWSATSGAETVSGAHTTDGSGLGSFISSLTGLTAGTTYYVKAYATNSAGTAYGNEVSFTETAAATPIVFTGSVSAITSSSFMGSGTVASIGGAPITARGLVGAFSPGATLSTGYVLPVAGTLGFFDTTVTGVPGSSTLFIKAYATNSYGTAYGAEISFTTLPPTAPVVTTDSVDSVRGTQAMAWGSVISDGGASISQTGVCWSTISGAESPSGPHSSYSGGGHGSFRQFMNSLTLGTTYYVKAYATNSVGTSFGSEISFTTSSADVSTFYANTITLTSASSGGFITSLATVTARGVCWSTTPGMESVSGAHTTAGSGTGSFNSTVSGLSAGSTYYAMAYATTSAGTVYGNEITFATPSTVTVPTVSTDSVNSITTSSVIGYGNVTSIGGALPSGGGFCWSTTSGTESIAGPHTTSSIGSGSFANFISGLASGTTYYLKAYATNSAGTSYGSEITFTTH